MLCDGHNMPTAEQPLHELPEPGKMDKRLLAVRANNRMASGSSSCNNCMTIGISLPSQRGMPTNDETLAGHEISIYSNLHCTSKTSRKYGG
jgi:hypothetical protein